MLEITEKSKCTGCHACANACPKQCITMTADEEGFLYPEIHAEECVNCGKCEKVCPLLNGKTKNSEALQIGYASYNKNEQIRLKSSSGGIFTLLAESILRSGGIVVGAVMSDDCKSVHHMIAETTEELEKLRGSKYLQSTIGNVFQTIKKTLDSGKAVLFTGTPCQISGLYNYLGKNYEQLYTQDLVCHGVPSPLVWKNYVETREKKSCATVQNVSFRNKSYGWKKYCVSFQFSNHTEYRKNLNQDVFMQGFLADIYLRPSCYKCQFKTKERQADITLADFWGIQNIFPELDDDKGISFVWIHSSKGMKLFQSISNQLVFKEVPVEEAIKFNPASVKNIAETKKRKLFYENFNKSDLEQIIRKYSKKPLKKRIRLFLRKAKRKLLK